MNIQRLKQIEKIFLAAIEIPLVERESFFKENCAADEDLRREVESLFSFEENSASFLDKPPEALAAEMFAEEEKKTNLIGQQIGFYKIKNLLGKGGMGEVYLAEDVRLNRRVALKFLSLNPWDNRNALRRFKQEAFSASALNHPNILTIYEFEADGDICYLATEYVEGETLREKMSREPLTIENVLRITEQIAFALAAAHKANIIHRDIKPENIMLREDGFVKILDFGLAKLTGQTEPITPSEMLTSQTALTKTGAIMGTTFYMSPEQVRGKTDIDARTDIWSLGVVLFEMLTGEVPFVGETTGDIIASVLKTDAPPLSKYIDCSPELEELINKSLAKNTEDRYQQMRDFASNVKNLKNRLEFEAALERSNPANTEKGSYRSKSSSTNNDTQMLPVRLTDDGERINSPKLVETPYKNSDREKFPFAVTAVALITLAVSIGGFIIWNSIKPNANVQQNSTEVSPVLSNNTTAKSSLQLDYSLTVQNYRDGRYKTPFKLSGEMIFANKDRVRLSIESSQNGFLYILNESPKDAEGKSTLNILFPSPTTNSGSSRLSAEEVIQIPENSWFELDAKEGTELVWLVWSPNSIVELESAKRFANPVDRGKIKDAALTDFVQSLLQKNQANRRNVTRDDDKRMSQITTDKDVLTHVIKMEHH